METREVNCCRNCPFYDGSDREMAICSHLISKKRGAYENIVSRSHFEPEPVEKWCPIKKDGYIQVKRDINDNIINKIKYLIINQ